MHALSHTQIGSNLHCIYPLSSGSGLQLNFHFAREELDSCIQRCTARSGRPKSEFEFFSERREQFFSESTPANLQKSIYIVLSPKLITKYKLVMILRYRGEGPSTDFLVRFVKFELKNPSAEFVRRFAFEDLPSTSSNLFLGGKNRLEKVIEFESDFEFSNETLRFINESCKADYSRSVLFLSKQLTFKLTWPEELKLFWNGSICPVQTGLRLETASAPINAELSFTNRPTQPLRTVSSLPNLSQGLVYDSFAELLPFLPDYFHPREGKKPRT